MSTMSHPAPVLAMSTVDGVPNPAGGAVQTLVEALAEASMGMAASGGGSGMGQAQSGHRDEAVQRLMTSGPGPVDLSLAPLVWGPCPQCETARFGRITETFWLPSLPCRECGHAMSYERDIEVPGHGSARISMDEEGTLTWGSGDAEFEVRAGDSASDLIFSWADMAGFAGLLDQGVTESKVVAVVALRQDQWITGSPEASLLVEMLLNQRFLMATSAESTAVGETARIEALSEWNEFSGYYDGDDLAQIKDVARVLTNYIEWRRPRMTFRHDTEGALHRRESLFGFGFLSSSADGDIEYAQVEIYCKDTDTYLTRVQERKNWCYRREASGFAAVVGWLWSLAHEYVQLETKAYAAGLVTVESAPQGRTIGSLI